MKLVKFVDNEKKETLQGIIDSLQAELDQDNIVQLGVFWQSKEGVAYLSKFSKSL